MKFLSISKILLIIAVPFLIFLIMLNFYGFDNNFYKEKFSEYGVNHNVPNADSLHEKVINFIKGESNGLPNEFNERERQHLLDVKKISDISRIALYVLIILFALLLMASVFILKVNNYVINFVGKVLLFGGILTIALAVILFFLINSDFSSAFESFHKLFFKEGSYTFDPAKEVIVNIYPEQLFMDLGIKISKGVIAASAILVLAGAFLLLRSKSKKNKKIR